MENILQCVVVGVGIEFGTDRYEP